MIAFLESELKQAQSGRPSEVLQLLIGRDDRVRYRIVPDLVHRDAPAEVKERTNPNEPAGPAIEKKGSKDLPAATDGHAQAEGRNTDPVTTAVGTAFGIGTLAAAASVCGSCAISQSCSSNSGSNSSCDVEGGPTRWY